MYTIGIDLGGTNIAAGIVNDNYEIIRKDSVPTGADRPGEEIVRDMANLCKKIIAESCCCSPHKSRHRALWTSWQRT